MCEGAQAESQLCDFPAQYMNLNRSALVLLPLWPAATSTSPLLSLSWLQKYFTVLFQVCQARARGGTERRAPIFQGRRICLVQSSRDCGQPQSRIKSCTLEGVPAGVNSHAVKQQVLKARPHKSTKLDAGDIIDPFC